MPTASRNAIVLAALVGVAVGDGLKPPSDQVGARVALDAIDTYRATVSRVFDRSGLIHCRFHPTCSAYGREAIRRYGLPRGGMLAVSRVFRCNPFSKGGDDPVP
jgi:putative membrane protein insertion efficiency factor